MDDKMIRKNTQLHKLYEYIINNYGTQKFTTEDIYKQARLIGLNPKSIGSSFQQLKKKGLVKNSHVGKKTSKERNQKQWWINKAAIITN